MLERVSHPANDAPAPAARPTPSANEGHHRRKVTILAYHAIDEPVDPFTVTPKSFELQMRLIRDEYQVVRLRDLPLELGADRPSHRLVALTFDDAFLDFAATAFPILESFQLPSTVFAPTAYVGDCSRWITHDKRFHRRPILSWDQIRCLDRSGLVEFGSHSVDHVRMSGLPAAEMRRQAVESRQVLERVLEKPVRAFAYPYGQPGDFSEETTCCLKEAGYTAAVTTCWGTRNSAQDLLRLRRISLSSGDDARMIRRKIDGAFDWLGWAQKGRSIVRAARRSANRPEDAFHLRSEL